MVLRLGYWGSADDALAAEYFTAGIVRVEMPDRDGPQCLWIGRARRSTSFACESYW